MMFEKEKEQYLNSRGFETTRLKAVLFDMDGVLFDSMPNHAYAWSHAMTQFGLAMSPEEAYMHEGRTGNGTINLLTQKYWGRNATEEEMDEIYQAKADVFNMRDEAPEMPGAKETLFAVKESGCTPVLVTGSGQISLLERLNKHFPGIFTQDKMVTSFDVKYGKPNPEPYLMGLKKAGIEPWEGLVIENAPLGVEAGVAAGIFTIAVNTGPLPDQVLLDAGANLLFHSMDELKENWNNIFATFR